MRRSWKAAAAAAGILGTSLITAGPAHAYSSVSQAYQACGAGFTTIMLNKPFTGATLFVIANPNTGEGCAVTVKTWNVGTASDVGVSYAGQTQDGNWRYYAGPIYSWGGCQEASGWDVWATASGWPC